MTYYGFNCFHMFFHHQDHHGPQESSIGIIFGWVEGHVKPSESTIIVYDHILRLFLAL